MRSAKSASPLPATPARLALLALLTPLFLLAPAATAAQPQAPTESAARAPAQPNIIIFLADDLGWADVSFRGSPIQTPTIDRLVAEGAELGRFYTQPICSPTRAALMTGRDPLKLGLIYSVILPWDNAGVHPEEHFMPESFRAAGYQTAITGKWHLGHAQETYTPRARGFDHFYGHLHTEVGYFPPFANQGGRDFQRNGVSIEEEGWEPDLVAAEASRWIRARDPSRPFFLYMPMIAPHTPLAAPGDLLQKYADLPDDRPAARGTSGYSRWLARLGLVQSLRPVYAAVVEGMDRAMGRVLRTLEDEGIAENTIVLFFSDNGGQTTVGAGGAANAPLRGGKGEVFEGGIRVVAALRWPGQVAAGSKMNQVMSAWDVFPTLAAAAGVKVLAKKRLDGINMWPALTTGAKPKRREPLRFACEIPIHGSFKLAVLDGRFKLVQHIEQELESTSVKNMLFDLSADPHEFTDLAAQRPQVVRRLAQDLHRWRSLHPIHGARAQLVPPPGWRAPKDWASYPRPSAELQERAAPGMAPSPRVEHMLDAMHGERGRLIYE